MSAPAALALYAEGLASGGALHAVGADGTVVALPLARWVGEPAPEEQALLRRVRGPALDLGCGPGRHVLALRARGVDALGVDVAPAVVALARGRGAPVLHGSVFGSLPRLGAWRSLLLLDGNLGIGGDPDRLLHRARTVAARRATLWVELDPPGRGAAPGSYRLGRGGRLSAPFPWSRVGADAIAGPAARAGWRVAERWEAAGRWFARLESAAGEPPCPR